MEALLNLGIQSGQETLGGPGCSECNGLGYRGRVAVHELLDFTPTLRRLPADKINAEDIGNQALSEGAYFTLGEGLKRKVLSGMTSVSEAIQLLQVD